MMMIRNTALFALLAALVIGVIVTFLHEYRQDLHQYRQDRDILSYKDGSSSPGAKQKEVGERQATGVPTRHAGSVHISLLNCTDSIHMDRVLRMNDLDLDMTATWFSVNKETAKTSDSSKGQVRAPWIDPLLLESYAKHYRTTYQRIASQLQSRSAASLGQLHLELERMGAANSTFQYALFDNVYVSKEGTVISDHNCQHAVRHSACNSTGYIDMSSSNETRREQDLVISLASRYGHATWHFAAEGFSSLAAVPKELLKTARIHVSRKNTWVMSWLELAGIRADQVVQGSIRAQQLLAPRTANCGSPDINHFEYMASVAASATPSIEDNPAQRNTILYVKRTKRTVQDDSELVKVMSDWAKAQNKLFVIHDDQKLPKTLRAQLERFAQASVVVGPHGAGLTLLAASRPGTCVVEWQDPKYMNPCFFRMAYFLRHLYISIPMVQWVVEPTKLRDALARCGSIVL